MYLKKFVNQKFWGKEEIMPRFSFVILHYNSIDDTIACVDSIIECCQNDVYRIYIVDNASPNGSGTQLLESYSVDDKVSVILSKENLGFARGNNLGIQQAIDDGFADFIVVLNNDTKIIQQDFCEMIANEYKKSGFAVLGPTICTPSGITSINPGRNHIVQGKDLKIIETFYSRALKFVRNKNPFLLWFNKKKMGLWNRVQSLGKTKFAYTENCLLHGCCLVFSKKYIDEMHGFDSRTFLYYEEEILYLHCMQRGLKTVYNPNLKIWHKEDGATDSVFTSPTAKQVFVYENILKSIQVYKKLLEEKNAKCVD